MDTPSLPRTWDSTRCTGAWAVRDCDLLIAVGVRFDDRVTANLQKFATNAKVIHVEVDPAEVHKNRYAEVAILADAKEALTSLIKRVSKKKHTDWRRQIARWKEEQPLRYAQNGRLKPQYIMEQLSEMTDGDAILATDVGQHQMFAAQYYPFDQPRRWAIRASISVSTDCTDRQFLGMLGMHGFYEANTAMHHSDVILAVGARFDDRVTNTVEKFARAPRLSTSISTPPVFPRRLRRTYPSSDRCSRCSPIYWP